MDFPPSKLKAGYGEQACYVLDCLAEEALKHTDFSWKRYSVLIRIPLYNLFSNEQMLIVQDDRPCVPLMKPEQISVKSLFVVTQAQKISSVELVTVGQMNSKCTTTQFGGVTPELNLDNFFFFSFN